MRIQRIVSMAALVVIAVNLTIQTFRSNKAETATQPQTSYSAVVEVVGKLETVERSRFTIGRPPGFLVKNGGALEVIEYDRGSRFDVMPAPRMLLIRETAGERTYSPLFLKE